MAKRSPRAAGPVAPIRADIDPAVAGYSLACHVAEAVAEAMLFSNADGTVTYANTAALQLFRGHDNDLIGANLRALVPDCPDELHHDSPGYYWTAWLSVQGDGLVEIQLNLRALDSKRPSALVLVAARTHALPMALDDSETERWAMAAQGSMSGFWHRPDVQADEEWWSPRMYQLLGYETGDLDACFSAIATRMHPEDSADFLAARAQHMQDDEPFDIQVRLRHSCGEYRHVRIRALVNRSSNGRVSMSGSAEDVTDLHNAIHDLRANQTRMRDMAKAASDFFFELDENFRVVWLSENYQSVTALDPNRFIGKEISTRIPDGGDKAQWDQYMTHLRRREPFRDLIQTHVNPQGRILYTSRSGSPVFDSDGTFRGYRGSGTDVTARMEMENALRESEERYRSIVEADQNAILVIDAHDMRIVDANSAASQLYALDNATLCSSQASELFARPDTVKDFTEGLIATGGTTHHHDIHQRRDGHRFPVDISASLVTLSGKRCIVLMVQDISEREQALAALRQSEARFKAIIENAPMEIYVKDTEGRFTVANPPLLEAWGQPAHNIIGRTAFDFWDEELAHKATLEDEEVMRINEPVLRDYTFTRASGEREIFRAKFPIADENGRSLGIAAISYDTTERNRTLLALEHSERRFRDFADQAADYLWETDAEDILTFVSERCVDVNGIPASELINQTLHEAHNETCDSEEMLARYKAAFAERRAMQCEWTRIRADGTKVRVFVSAKPMFDSNGQFLGYRGITRDITEAYELSTQLAYQATHDSLTGLVNRPELERRLERLLQSVRDDGATHALCYLDLDQFKVVNDTCGHMAGDALLERLAERLTFRVRQRDTVARMGGDEFAIIIEHCSIEHALQVVNNLRESLSEFVFVWKDKQFQVGASMGLVPITPEFADAIEVLSAADSACYVAKEQGRNRIQIYSSNDAELARRRGEMDWVSHISSALSEGRFRLRAQPVLSLSSADTGMHHCELLVNLVDRDGAIVPPGAFLPAAERYNLATRIDRWVVTRALSWLASDDDGRGRPTICGINLSAQSLSDVDFLEFIRGECARFNVPASQLCFEITETTAIANLDKAVRFMESLKLDGAHFALDDFGKGLSSFGYLRALPVDYVKIDAQFVRDVLTDPIDLAMVRSINEVARLMSKRTIAEGVESHEILGVLREIGVDFAQGYATGEPLFID